MTNKHFSAILAKNQIARAIRDTKGSQKVEISTYILENLLIDIEKYTGEANQPCVKDIVNDEKGWL